MTSGYFKNSQDLDEIFMPWQSGDKAGVTGYWYQDTDIREQFQALTVGDAPADVGMRVGNVDIAGRFQDINVPLVGTVNLIADSAIDLPTNRTASAGFKFDADGKVYNWENGYDAGTDWIVPNSPAGSTYEIALTALVWNNGSSFIIGSPTLNDWQPLDIDRIWRVQDTTLGGSSTKATCTFAIRKDGGAILDSAEYIMEARYDNA